MSEAQNQFEFTGAVIRDGKLYSSLCLDLDVASQGKTPREAKKMLAQAVTLYLETCFENGIPYLRPVPTTEDPRHHAAENLIEIFPLRVNFKVHTFA
jgi:predicted RNase H-like HicB family nuclease